MTLPNDVRQFIAGLRAEDSVRFTIEAFLDEVLAWDDVSYELSEGLKGVRMKRRSTGRRFVNAYPISAKVQFGPGKKDIDHFVVKSPDDLEVALGHATEAFERAR